MAAAQAEAPPAMRTYAGGCHCGAVRWEVQIPDNEHKAIICNCSMCAKKAIVHVIVPPDRFKLLRGEENLTLYQFNTRVARHLFCKTCGIHSFYRARSHPDDYDVNARCFEDPTVVERFKLEYFDGLNWEKNIQNISTKHGSA